MPEYECIECGRECDDDDEHFYNEVCDRCDEDGEGES